MSGYYTGLYHGRREAKEEITVSMSQQQTMRKSTLHREENPKHDRKRQRKQNVSNNSEK